MTPEQHQRATDLFIEVCELPPEQREAFLRESCSDDPEVLAEVESLLMEDATSEGFLDRPALGSAIGLDIDELTDGAADDDPLVGRRVGRYQVIRLLATGGMGAVYLAQQETPRRTVALKVMKQGISSPAMVRRFEHEVQMLGRLQHPGIAQIFDAGTCDVGHTRQPYFAMEYVEG
ncbi:MAG: protein kinase, partial [Phycisphaerales bacterium]|nr:protein kinase [Phycisphaerales bacterium]